MNLSGDFLFAEVRFISQGPFNAKYSLVQNGAVVKIKNSTHVRLLEDQYGEFPESFKVLAPINAVTVKSGDIPNGNIQEMKASDYLAIRKRYLGH